MSVTHRTVFCRVNVPLARTNSKSARGQSHRDFSLDQLDQVVGLSTLRERTYITSISIRKEKQKTSVGLGKFLGLKPCKFGNSLTIFQRNRTKLQHPRQFPLSPSGYLSQGWSIFRKGW